MEDQEQPGPTVVGQAMAGAIESDKVEVECPHLARLDQGSISSKPTVALTP
jgi:hypothetical protein